MRVCQFRHYGTSCMSLALPAGHGSRENLVLQTPWPLSIARPLSYTETIRIAIPAARAVLLHYD